jgi:MerR family mercuric resistance operon transcriptional regulator
MAMTRTTQDSRTGSILRKGTSTGAAIPGPSYSAGECAKLAGVSTDTLRYYERQRLLPAPRAANGYRRYPTGALARIRVIRSALAVGFTVEELTQILGARDHGLSPCQQVRHLAGSKLEALGSQIRELQHLRTALRKTIDDWDHQLAKTPSGGRAALLESLAAARPSAARHLSPLLAPALRRKLNEKLV